MIRIRPLAAILLAAATLATAPALAQDTTKGPGKPDREAQRRAVFDRMDNNRDGFVDKDESKTARLALFERLDANKDGKLTLDEMTMGRRGRGQGPKGQSGDVNTQTDATPPAAPPASRSDQRQGRGGRLFQRMDANKDGAISRVEWLAADEARFGRCDVNKDGKLAFGECQMAQGGRKRPPSAIQ